MKSLWKLLAVSLLVCCQVSPGQNATNASQVPAPHYTCPTQSGVEILSDTSGVDFNHYAKEWSSVTYRNWLKVMPREAKWPSLTRGQVQIGLKILPDGKVKPRDIALKASSGSPALDRAALKAIKKSKYQPLPKEFKRPYLDIRACFDYNMQSPQDPSVGNHAPKS
jgi:TonB family protein